MATCLKPGCPTLVSKGRCAKHGQRPNADVQKWYHLARWYRLREQVKREQPLCEDCMAEGQAEPWVELDHTIPHSGDPLLFWSRSNVTGKCKRHHAIKTRRGL